MSRVTFTPQPLEMLTVPARDKHTATIIFVHVRSSRSPVRRRATDI